MGRGRAPCCDKTKVRTGPWSPAEDLRLMNFIQSNGHSNWRALPKQAGLLRCGKSCRLRWINYLRPDVKRGNFTREEENTIIQLHTSIGNKWSKIASCLPGRTDNEIKNVWNTHLKKRLQKSGAADLNSQKNDDETVDKSSTILEEKACMESPSSQPSEFDGDFWELLESLDPLQPQVGADDTDLEGKVEVGRWLRFLENELGLANDGDHLPQIPKCQDFIQPQFTTAICRPTSPAHHYLGI